MTTTTKVHGDFSEFLDLLIQESVRFLIVGAHALAIHGIPRFTGDLDIWVQPCEENARKLVKVLSAFGFPSYRVEHFSVPERIAHLGVRPVQIDVMTSIDGVLFEEAWTGRLESMLGNHRVAFIGLREYIMTKRSSGRLKDAADLESLSEVLGELDKIVTE